MSALINQFKLNFAETYALFLKTQSYHWHVRGSGFKTLHELFEDQYKNLIDAIDELAERMVILGHHAPASFKELDRLKSIRDANPQASAEEMLLELANDHGLILESLKHLIKIAEEHRDEASIALISDRISNHEKMQWILKSSLSEQR